MRVMDINEDSRFHPSDFTNERYYGMNCFNRKNNVPVLVMMSRTSNPPHWTVIDGYSQMFYLNRSDAMDYCKQKGYLRPKH